VTDEEMIKLAQMLVRIPSVSGEEQEVAKCLADRAHLRRRPRGRTRERDPRTGRPASGDSSVPGDMARSMPAPAEAAAGSEAISLSAPKRA